MQASLCFKRSEQHVINQNPASASPAMPSASAQLWPQCLVWASRPHKDSCYEDKPAKALAFGSSSHSDAQRAGQAPR